MIFNHRRRALKRNPLKGKIQGVLFVKKYHRFSIWIKIYVPYFTVVFVFLKALPDTKLKNKDLAVSFKDPLDKVLFLIATSLILDIPR